jgi:hypothetical protein
MKQDDIMTNGLYRAASGARVRILQKGVKGHTARRDHVRVQFAGGPRNGQEAKLPTRDIQRVWTTRDEELANKRAALNKKVGATRVRLAMLGFGDDEVRVSSSSDDTALWFHGEAAERVLEILERALGEGAA